MSYVIVLMSYTIIYVILSETGVATVAVICRCVKELVSEGFLFCGTIAEAGGIDFGSHASDAFEYFEEEPGGTVAHRRRYAVYRHRPFKEQVFGGFDTE